MMKALLFLLVLLISGCATMQEKLIVKDKFVVPSFGDEMTSIPPQVPPIDLSKATQKDVADWLVDNEKRVTTLEGKLATFKSSSADLVNKLKLKDGEYVIVDLSKKDDVK